MRLLRRLQMNWRNWVSVDPNISLISADSIACCHDLRFDHAGALRYDLALMFRNGDDGSEDADRWLA